MVKPRAAKPTVKFIDTYCELYKDLFVEVRAYEFFKYIHAGLISELKRKSLPEIAKVVGLENGQGLHHFLAESPRENINNYGQSSTAQINHGTYELS